MKLDDIRARDARWNFDGAKPASRDEGVKDSWGDSLKDRRYLVTLVDRYEKALREIATLTDYEDEPDGSDISAIVHAALESGSAGRGGAEHD